MKLAWATKLAGVGLATLLALTGFGCSYQYRTADPGVDWNGLTEMLASVGTNIQSGASSEADSFFALVEDPNTTIYFAGAPGTMGTTASVFSLARYDFLGPDFVGYFPEDISEVRLFFAVRPTAEGGRECALLMSLQFVDVDSPDLFAFTCTSVTVEGGEFVALLGDSVGDALVVRSFDVEDSGDLSDVIQLKVSDFDSNGEEQPNGKFSTLVGFGP